MREAADLGQNVVVAKAPRVAPKRQPEPRSPFYRVALKAIIFDDQQRMLVFQNGNGRGLYEIPGGGWEHGEGVLECLQRELQEEAGVAITVDVEVPLCVFQTLSDRGYQALRIVYRGRLLDPARPMTPGDGMIAARFVTKDELIALRFVDADEPIKQFVDRIWPAHARA